MKKVLIKNCGETFSFKTVVLWPFLCAFYDPAMAGVYFVAYDGAGYYKPFDFHFV